MITLRQDKGSELTFEEVDNNFKSFYYSSSVEGTDLVLYRTGSEEHHRIDLTEVPGLGGVGIYKDDTFISLAKRIKFKGPSVVITNPVPNEVQIQVVGSGDGTGLVHSVNNKIGDVILNTDDISDLNRVNRYVTQNEKSKLGLLQVTSSVNVDQIKNLAYSSIQEGSNISQLINDKGYLNKIFDSYPDIDSLVNNQNEQEPESVIYVENSEGDPSISFSSGEVKKHAWYKFKGTVNGDLDDYILISAPYSTGDGFEDAPQDGKVYGRKDGMWNVVQSQTFDSDITVTLPEGTSFGPYKNGDIIESTGKTPLEVILMATTTTLNPTFVNPSVSLNSNIHNNGTYEVGETLNIILTSNFNRGRINGNNVNGTWNPSAKQEDRSGPVISYEIQGEDNGTSNQKTINHTVMTGVNTFLTKVFYDEGPQPLNSVGNPYGSPLPPGSVNASRTLRGSYKRFFGSSSNGNITSSSQIRGLSGEMFDNGSLTFNFNSNLDRHFYIALPITRNLTKVIDQNTNADITNQFNGTSVQVNDAGGVPRDYTLYKMSVAEPFTNHTFIVTLS